MKKTLITLLLLLPLTLFAQVTGSLRGTIIEKESDEPLPYVTIALTPQGSSAPTAGCSTNEDGTFRLNNIKPGSYTVTASFVGYIDESRTINITAGKRDINLGTIYMKSDRKMLQEVVVTEQRSQMSFEIDKRVFTVDQNIATTGGSASDALTKLKEAGCTHIKFMCLVAAPEGVAKVQADHPDVDIYTAALDEKLNDHAYIVPGLGDAGDRIFGTL